MSTILSPFILVTVQVSTVQGDAISHNLCNGYKLHSCSLNTELYHLFPMNSFRFFWRSAVLQDFLQGPDSLIFIFAFAVLRGIVFE